MNGSRSSKNETRGFFFTGVQAAMKKSRDIGFGHYTVPGA